MDLQREFARRRDDQGQRRGGRREPLGLAEQILGHGQPIGDGFARAGLGRDEKVAVDGVVGKDGDLNRGRLVVAALCQSSGERRTCGRK